MICHNLTILLGQSEWLSVDCARGHQHGCFRSGDSTGCNMVGKKRGERFQESSAPNLVVTTPAGQLHELGALMVATTAASEGWRVTYLGPNLPTEEIAGAAIMSNARAVTLSLVYPGGDFRIEDELRRLKSYLPASIELIVGGRAAGDYVTVLKSIGAILLPDLLSLRTKLEDLRTLR